jgi:histidyl-tRNA synthetase
MKIQPVRGTRDFYPEDMRLRRWLEDRFREVSLRHGFEEYDGPVFEHLDLYTAKSGEEIVGQLYNFEDRGGRRLALRPEITPTLARMINQRHASLPRPIRWFSIPRLWRAERPQRGRLREFFQWNIDIVGDDSVTADAECIAVAVDLLREIGLTPEDVIVLIGSRRFLDAKLSEHGLARDAIDRLYAVIDKKRKVSPEAFHDMLVDALVGSSVQAETVVELVAGGASEQKETQALFALLAQLGVAEYCKLDLSIVRGLAYYTGIVYEIYDRGQSMRAIAGGGRYDQLCDVLGGPKMPATGFGMGDVVLADLLAEKGKLRQLARELDCYVIGIGKGQEKVLEVVSACRRGREAEGKDKDKGLRTDFYHGTSSNVGKQLKAAEAAGARFVLILREDLLQQEEPQVIVKDMAARKQWKKPLAELMRDPRRAIGGS